MTDASDIQAAQEEWWDRGLTSAGRSDILRAARLKLPARIKWRYLSPKERAAVDHMRPSEFRPENRQATPEPSPEPTPSHSSGTDLAVENALLRSTLRLAARTLRDYHDAPHFEIEGDQPPMMEVIVPEMLRHKAADALARADEILTDKDRGRGR